MVFGEKADTWSLALPLSQDAKELNAARKTWALRVNLSEGKPPNLTRTNLMLSAVFSKLLNPRRNLSTKWTSLTSFASILLTLTCCRCSEMNSITSETLLNFPPLLLSCNPRTSQISQPYSSKLTARQWLSIPAQEEQAISSKAAPKVFSPTRHR